MQGTHPEEQAVVVTKASWHAAPVSPQQVALHCPSPATVLQLLLPELRGQGHGRTRLELL